MPIWSRDNRLARSEGIGQRAGNDLRFMAIRSDVDIRSADELGHFLRAGKAVVEDNLQLHSYFLRQCFQAIPVTITIATENMRMSCARNDINDILMFRKNLRQSLNDVFDSLVRREQAEGEQNRLSFDSEPVFEKIRIEKRQIWNPMGNHVDLAVRHLEDLL